MTSEIRSATKPSSRVAGTRAAIISPTGSRGAVGIGRKIERREVPDEAAELGRGPGPSGPNSTRSPLHVFLRRGLDARHLRDGIADEAEHREGERRHREHHEEGDWTSRRAMKGIIARRSRCASRGSLEVLGGRAEPSSFQAFSFPVGEGGSRKPRRMGRAGRAFGEAESVQVLTAQWSPICPLRGPRLRRAPSVPPPPRRSTFPYREGKGRRRGRPGSGASQFTRTQRSIEEVVRPLYQIDAVLRRPDQRLDVERHV